MKTEALWLSSICYHSLSQSMGLSVLLYLAACLYPHPTSMLPFPSRNTVYIYCLRHISRVVPTLLKIEYMDSFVSINNSVIPTEKVNSQLQKRDMQAPERCKERVGSVWGMWTQQMLWDWYFWVNKKTSLPRLVSQTANNYYFEHVFKGAILLIYTRQSSAFIEPVVGTRYLI